MILPIRYYGDPVLRRRARPVVSFDEELAELARNMIETMHHDNGVGLAAPQVGVPLRLFVAGEYRRDEEGELEPIAEHVMVNPEISRRHGVQRVVEGCLSVPGIFVDELDRDLRLQVRYQDLQGEWHEREAEGHFAQVIQHEYDHLDGVLFFDRLPEEERRGFLERHRGELADIQRQAKALLKDLRGRAPARGRR